MMTRRSTWYYYQCNQSLMLVVTVLLLTLCNLTSVAEKSTSYYHDDKEAFAHPNEHHYNLRNDTHLPLDLHRRLSLESVPLNSRKDPLRILYTVTTLAEYDEGHRATTKGFDRLSNLLIPVVKEGVESMLEKGYHVDVFIVSHYEMTRPQLLRDALPDSVHVRYWDNAAPISYKPDQREKDPKAKLWKNTLALARQHRFVVKDNLMDYDMFLNFEDDMILHGDMVEHHLQMTQKLFQLRETAPDEVPESQLSNFYGPLTKDQLKRCYPGLLRVEVLLEEETYPTQPELDPVPVTPHEDIDPAPCCHLKAAAHEEKRPAKPTSDKLFLWETNIIALGVRHMEALGWVALLRGPRPRQGEYGLTVSDYWSGTNKYFDKQRRPNPGEFNMINNQGGWMGTRQQIWEWHTEICPGGFLPPFEGPHYNWDGLDPRNVEFWSGGLNLFTARHACNMQRLVMLESPDEFARQLIYHSANNKQRQLTWRKRSFVKINDLYGQLLTVAKDAEADMKEKK
ncbi:hypothetical protein IV203_012914 [Nitzschia inconspicua]|uniref:Uncharacterized protein n=1 Tax=Nitzschia inconspicua TaxID=303405 RepID=A0A9K3M466_9STRA|nr:hypothetical protein IV203_012914 [Nitzschia inconspicua]